MLFEHLNEITKNSIPFLILFCLVVICLCTLCEWHRKFQRKNKSFKISFKPFAHGIIFGKTGLFKVAYSPTQAEGHVICIGSSGSGKSSTLLIPSLRQWNDGTYIAIDIAGDLDSNVPENPKFPKLIFEPENPHTIPFNIFAPVDQLDGKPDKQAEYLINLAFLIMPENKNMSDATAYFQNGGRKILIACLLAFCPEQDFPEIVEKICSHDYRDLFSLVDACEYDLASEQLVTFRGSNERNIAGCLEALQTTLSLFRNPVVQNSIRRPRKGELSVTMDSIEEHNMIVKISDSVLSVYSPILRILTMQMLNYLSGRPKSLKTPILVALDEMASLGGIDIIGSLRKLRKKHVRLLCCTQSITDIDLTYSRDERIAMMANFSFRICLRASDLDTQEYFSRLIGADPDDSHRRAVPPEEFDRLEDDLILAYPGGWVRLRKNYYFKLF